MGELSARFSDNVKTWSNAGVPLTASATINPTQDHYFRILWVSIQPSSDNSTSNLVTVAFQGAAETLYTAYVVGHWQTFVGSLNKPLVITLANSQPVAVTIHYQEVP